MVMYDKVTYNIIYIYIYTYVYVYTVMYDNVKHHII